MILRLERRRPVIVHWLRHWRRRKVVSHERRLLHVIHLLFQHLKTARASVGNGLGETVEGSLFVAAIPLGCKFHRVGVRRRHRCMEWNWSQLIFRPRWHDWRHRGLDRFFRRSCKGQHRPGILAKHLSGQMGFVSQKEFVVVRSQFGSARNARKIPFEIT